MKEIEVGVIEEVVTNTEGLIEVHIISIKETPLELQLLNQIQRHPQVAIQFSMGRSHAAVFVTQPIIG